MAVEKKEKKPKKGSKVVLIIVGVVVGLLLIGGVAFGGYYFAAKNAPSADKVEASSEKSKDGQELTFEVDEILVNLADEGKARYLKIKIFIGYMDSKELASELTTKKPIIRDTINNTLRTKKTTDLTAEGEELLKNILSEKINGLLTTGKITNVYFSEILIQ
jgi:flagellar protein FliL